MCRLRDNIIPLLRKLQNLGDDVRQASACRPAQRPNDRLKSLSDMRARRPRSQCSTSFSLSSYWSERETYFVRHAGETPAVPVFDKLQLVVVPVRTRNLLCQTCGRDARGPSVRQASACRRTGQNEKLTLSDMWARRPRSQCSTSFSLLLAFRSETRRVLRKVDLVPKGGLEPPRVASHAPQTCASASSATSAKVVTQTVSLRFL